ncbi:MAG: hypothetical protein NVSMB14_04750 [Isosphaeraceae bacterium]
MFSKANRSMSSIRITAHGAVGSAGVDLVMGGTIGEGAASATSPEIGAEVASDRGGTTGPEGIVIPGGNGGIAGPASPRPGSCQGRGGGGP